MISKQTINKETQSQTGANDFKDSSMKTEKEAEGMHSNTNTKTKIETIPIHEPKQLTRKENQANELVNYSLNSTTRDINKIPKGKYGFIEEYDLIKAEKLLSKRRSNVKYDQNMVYGKASNATLANAKGNNNIQKVNQKNTPIDCQQEIKEEKEEDDINEYDDKNENENEDADNNDSDNKNIKDKVYYKPKPKPRLRRKKKVVIVEPPHNRTLNTNVIKEESQMQSRDEKQNQTIDDLENKGNDYHGNFHINENNDYRRNVSQTLSSNVNPNNKNFLLLFDNPLSSETNQTSKKNVINEEHDIYSCNNCEPVYLMCILNNEPLKVLKCLICNNLINKTSLNFYLKKYKNEIVSNQKKKTEKQIKHKDQHQQQQRIKQREKESVDEYGITQQWGELIESNKARIKEQIIYDIVDGKSKMTKQQKEIALNKIKDTPLEKIVKRKMVKESNSKPIK